METETPGQPSTARVFFALWPDDPIRAKLAHATSVLHDLHGGRPMRPDSLHLTLVFIGQVEEGQVADLKAMAGKLQPQSFETVFDRQECWRHNHIGHLGASETPPNLRALVMALETGLKAIGIGFDKRPYKPHITLLRKANCQKAGPTENGNPALAPILWPARDFVLVKSSLRPDGARYEELGRWPLL